MPLQQVTLGSNAKDTNPKPIRRVNQVFPLVSCHTLVVNVKDPNKTLIIAKHSFYARRVIRTSRAWLVEDTLVAVSPSGGEVI